ncbi:MAG: FG-GAP-like repeat-containing protein [Gaiellaceae bacterium]
MRRNRWLAGLLGALFVASMISGTSGALESSSPTVFGVPRTVVTVSADVGAATEIATGDLNGDNLSDIVVTRITYPPAHVTHPIGIFLSDGHGSFTDGASMWAGAPARTEWGRQILIADFNGDRRNDIFVADHGYDAAPYPGHPNALALSTSAGKLVDASRNLPSESGFSHSATAADINLDGSVDIFVGNLCCGDRTPPEILLNDGGGQFTRRLDLLPADVQQVESSGKYTRSLFVDVNGDGAPDLVLGADDHTATSRVLMNDGTGHFRYASAALPSKPFGPNAILISLATLDVNRDGRADLLAGFTRGAPFYVGRFIQVLIGNGDGTFRDETRERLPSQTEGNGWPYALHVADVNADGRLDFAVVVNGAAEPTPLYFDTGTGVFRLASLAPAAALFAIVDANADGRADIFSTFPANSGAPEHHAVQLQLVVPGTPQHVRATATTNRIQLSWSRVRGATSYEVWRSASASLRRLAARTTNARFDDRRARSRVTYTYTVRAHNAAGPGAFSAPVRCRRSKG